MYENVYIIATVTTGVCVMFGLYTLNKLVVSNKLLEAERKLRSRIANFEQNYGELRANPEGVISDGIGNMGIEGILQALNVGDISPAMLKELGLPAWLLPVAQGFLAKMKTKGASDGTQEKKHISQTDV